MQALELGGGGSEELQANYLTISPTTGAIGANFAGHISAQGIDLIQSPGSSYGAAGSIIWTRQSDGAQVARIDSYKDQPNRNYYQLSSFGVNPGDTLAGMQIGAQGYAAGGGWGTIRAFASSVGNANGDGFAGSCVRADAQNYAGTTAGGVLIMDDQGNSGFIMNGVGSGKNKTQMFLGNHSRGYSNAPVAQGLGNIWKQMIHVIYDPDANCASGWWYAPYSGSALACFCTDWAASAVYGVHCELWDASSNGRIEFGPTTLTPSTIGRGGCMAVQPFSCIAGHAYGWQFALDSVSAGNITTWSQNEGIWFQLLG